MKVIRKYQTEVCSGPLTGFRTVINGRIIAPDQKFHYTLRNTHRNSDSLGKCEVCGEYCNTVFHQVEKKDYNFSHKNKRYSGKTRDGCIDFFGHKECLESVRHSEYLGEVIESVN